MDIPIQNIYYLLCYAWDKLNEGDIVAVEPIDPNSDMLNLLGSVLANGVSHILQQRLDRGYAQRRETSAAPRGKIDIGRSLKQTTMAYARLACVYDEMSDDVLHNQIIAATLDRLAANGDIDAKLRKNLRGLGARLGQVRRIELAARHFGLVQLHSNNYFYDFLLKICKLIYDALLIAEQRGESAFRDFERDEKKMRYLYENFVRNFYRRHCPEHFIGRQTFGSRFRPDKDTFVELPKMQTDIILELENCIVIIDTKYSAQKFKPGASGLGSPDSGDVYQLYGYMMNHPAAYSVERKPIYGILLYPAAAFEARHHYTFEQDRISVVTLNMNRYWREIRKELLQLVE